MRYIARPAKFHRRPTQMADCCEYWDGEAIGENSLKAASTGVIVDEEANAFTGLYDAAGNMLYRAKEKMGFF